MRIANNVLLLGSITSPKTQVLNSNLLSPSIYRSFFLLSLLTPPPCLLRFSPHPISLPVALNLAHILYLCLFTLLLQQPPPPWPLSASPLCLFSDLLFLSETLFRFISGSVFIYYRLPYCCECLFVTSLLPQLQAKRVQATCFYSNCN